jgi:glutamate 5-kinase
VIVVVKVGTSTIAGDHGLNGRFLLAFAGAIGDLVARGHHVVVVTSGAVGTGRWRLAAPRPRTIAEKQAAAAVGQGLLMHAYESLLAPLGVASAQLLLTRGDLVDRQRYLNARTTLHALLAYDPPVVPIVNENDSVAIEELKFGDNDTLSALVAGLVDADWLFILSDVAGLFDRHPGLPGAALVPEVEEITPEVEALAGSSGSDLGTGGMATKLDAAKIATSSGTSVALLSGANPGAILDLLEDRPFAGTRFRARGDRLEARRKWLAFGRPVRGTLVLDEGAVKAVLRSGKSLLSAGIRELAGEFDAGEAVSLRADDGRELARGICNYGSVDLARILGKKTSEIEDVLGFKVADEVVHRNNMVVL